ncbi:hypothetical protein Rhopal_006375-T1 [Rhodotorula paludigena]|uniref:ATP-dependent RNA helicase n=1 Tax=Rhodotorula paludigena TaxID=86838 RepID=A0AAV5GSW1_9BASI|nr:hypothetical protein Rhopal_006375-T1 [Rhodotorula paludigena]
MHRCLPLRASFSSTVPAPVASTPDATTSPAASAPAPEPAQPPRTYASIKASLHAPVYRAVTEKPFKYETMTDVQAAVLSRLPRLSSSPEQGDAIEAAQDLLVRAKTGTGKTLGFLIPALEGRLRDLETFLENYQRENPKASSHEAKKALAAHAKSTVGALILSPTRELATQIANEAIALTSHLPQLGVRLLVGGASKSNQLREWIRSPSNDIVVATPGRCVDVLQTEPSVRKALAKTRLLILDEADTLLDMGFSDDIATVANHLPDVNHRQTFLFSATVSKQIREVARKSLKTEHEYIDTVPADEVDTHLHIPQFHTILPKAEDQLVHVLRLLAHDQLLWAQEAAKNGGTGGGKAVVFLPTTRLTEMFASILLQMKAHLPWGRDTLIVEIHSKKNQTQRTRASDLFRRASSGYSILVTSDVSARGVDYPGVTRVIQVGIPPSRDMYIHRVGRTGRAGKAGRGDLVLLPWESGFISWQLNDIPLKPCTVGDTQRELVKLASEWDANPPTFTKPTPAPPSRNSRFPSRLQTRPMSIPPVLSPRIDALPDSLKTNVLPALDSITVRETFASLLGYYINKAHELRTTKQVVLTGLKRWSVEALGLEEEPYVSDEFLNRLGMNDGRTKRRDKPRYGGGRGGYGGGGFGGGRGRSESYDRSDGARWERRGRQSGGGRSNSSRY